MAEDVIKALIEIWSEGNSSSSSKLSQEMCYKQVVLKVHWDGNIPKEKNLYGFKCGVKNLKNKTKKYFSQFMKPISIL